MRSTAKNTKIWAKPELVRMGRIGDVAASGPGTVQTNGGPACTPPSPSCVKS